MFTRTITAGLTAIIMAVLTAGFATQGFGQGRVPVPSTTDVPTAAAPVYPHDFSDKYYFTNGVNPKGITERLTGSDFLSTLNKTEDARFSSVRVLITLPAYTQSGEAVFFSPLGKLTYFDFTQDRAGANAQNIASRHPIYVFPYESGHIETQSFAGTRQAALMDDSVSLYSKEMNPLGVRQILTVHFTNTDPKADYNVLGEMAKRNGVALDGGPIVKTAADIKELLSYGLITIDEGGKGGSYAIVPIILNADNGGIAKDAFLSTVTQNGKPLDGEKGFVTKFGCAQGTGRCTIR
jgi:hypothetical protein